MACFCVWRGSLGHGLPHLGGHSADDVEGRRGGGYDLRRDPRQREREGGEQLRRRAAAARRTARARLLAWWTTRLPRAAAQASRDSCDDPLALPSTSKKRAGERQFQTEALPRSRVALAARSLPLRMQARYTISRWRSCSGPPQRCTPSLRSSRSGRESVQRFRPSLAHPHRPPQCRCRSTSRSRRCSR